MLACFSFYVAVATLEGYDRRVWEPGGLLYVVCSFVVPNYHWLACYDPWDL